MEVVELNASHKDLLYAFWSQKAELFGQPLQLDLPSIERRFHRYFFSETKTRLYGIIQDGVLEFTLGVIPWKHMPYYTFVELNNRYGNRSRGNVMKYSGLVMARILQDMTAEKRHTFYFVVRRRHVAKHLEFSSDMTATFESLVPEAAQFHYYTEAIIPAGTLPKYGLYRTIIGRTTYNVDLIIRKAVMKPEFAEKLFNE